MYLLVILIPLLSAIGSGLGGRYLGGKGAGLLASVWVIISCLLSFILCYEILINGSTVYIELGRWIESYLLITNFGLQFDMITAVMLIVVITISGLVHIYSTSYMREDPHLPRFMSYLSLFTFFMLVLVTSNNYVQLFIGWEGVGLCSYLLINFWFTRIQANKAAIKAMLINRIGDIGLMLAIILIWKEFGTLDYCSLFSTLHPSSACTWICILLTIGAIGKSAQLGLHTWLPDAMEGPTPVSALIHAATMVTAGVFLIIRSAPLFDYSPTATIIVGLVGSLTAFFAATVGLVQSDIKKVIAYSTCSQLGYMVMACGTYSCISSLYHLLTHAFFKALLFLGAGSIIHALLDEQDLRKMGGIVRDLPLTYILMLIGSLSLTGFPYLSGFYSKDLILELTYNSYCLISIYWLATITAFLTAFYSFRLIYLSFVSKPNLTRTSTAHLQEADWNLLGPLLVLGVGSIIVGYIAKNMVFASGIRPLLPVPTIVSLVPVIMSVTGILLVFIRPYIKSRGSRFLLFLFYAWEFNQIANYYLGSPVWKFGHIVSYRTIDRGILEILGPTGIAQFMINRTQQLSNLQSGLLFNYVLVILVGIAIALQYLN
uniref:NADH dehydrogenase subunit 5 n=1 Tax=Erythropodium caribaeorum TaxID=86550 RepID=UPI001F12EFA8|nr:NADH dehydrogenase subunit 5 [Erythropodium caribaeorum]UKP87618.1 NADH dehydrogenase subunit 5 [Erythropodium caribaeorum]